MTNKKTENFRFEYVFYIFVMLSQFVFRDDEDIVPYILKILLSIDYIVCFGDYKTIISNYFCFCKFYPGRCGHRPLRI